MLSWLRHFLHSVAHLRPSVESQEGHAHVCSLVLNSWLRLLLWSVSYFLFIIASVESYYDFCRFILWSIGSNGSCVDLVTLSTKTVTLFMNDEGLISSFPILTPLTSFFCPAHFLGLSRLCSTEQWQGTFLIYFWSWRDCVLDFSLFFFHSNS